MLTTAGMTRRNMGAKVGRPLVSAVAAGGVAAMGVESGGPGSGGAGERASHQPEIAARATRAAMNKVLCILSSPAGCKAELNLSSESAFGEELRYPSLRKVKHWELYWSRSRR
jgi:hypothetical protein